ncbi:MAG: tetratricopeptide repeat protein [Hyphomicrobium sp.]
MASRATTHAKPVSRACTLLKLAPLFIIFSGAPALADETDQHDCAQQDRAYVALLACSRLLTAPDLDPVKRVQYVMLRGRASLTLFDFGEAVEDFTEVLKAEPDNLIALAGRAEALSQHGSHANAAEDWTRIVALRPDDIAAGLQAGLSHNAAGTYEKAVAAFGEVVKRDAANTEAHVGLAKAYEKLGQRDKADESLAAALKINPASASALMTQGEIAEGRGDAKLAIESYLGAVKANGMLLKPRQALQRLGVETPTPR